MAPTDIEPTRSALNLNQKATRWTDEASCNTLATIPAKLARRRKVVAGRRLESGGSVAHFGHVLPKQPVAEPSGS